MNLTKKNDEYASIKIGNQIWMADNLRVTKYRNGDDILCINDIDTWLNTFQGAFTDKWRAAVPLEQHVANLVPTKSESLFSNSIFAGPVVR